MCCRENAYARVFGVPRKFNEAVVLDIYSIRMVEDPHEVLFHLMEAMVVTLHRSRGKPPVRTLNSWLSTSFVLNVRARHSQDFMTQNSQRLCPLHSFR